MIMSHDNKTIILIKLNENNQVKIIYRINWTLLDIAVLTVRSDLYIVVIMVIVMMIIIIIINNYK